MGYSHCFCGVFWRPKTNTVEKRSGKSNDFNKNLKLLQVQLEEPEKCVEINERKSTSFSFPAPYAIPGASRYRVKVMNHESPVVGETEEEEAEAYEGEDVQNENLSMKRENSDLDIHALACHLNDGNDQQVGYERILAKDAQDLDLVRSGHLSDPGIGRDEFWGSPKLARSCSDLGMVRKVAADQIHLRKSQSFQEVQELTERVTHEVLDDSPISNATHGSADKVMLKKRSSSKILPSRSKKLWWKLFLWSHRNLHRSETSKPPEIRKNSALSQQGGYSSDTLEPRQYSQSSKQEKPISFTEESVNYRDFDNENQGWDGMHGNSGLWPQNQWVALPVESPTMTRVDEWVKGLLVQHDDVESSIPFPNSPETGISPTRSLGQSPSHPVSNVYEEIPARNSAHLASHAAFNVPEEIAYANNVVQSLNLSSTVAHMVAIGLKVVPQLSQLVGLRFVNLSSNLIVHITPGSLPKGLHTLDLSKNKISSTEGLRELTRLRVLDLSYNRISRIGQGLSNCILIKELYLVGNKISDVEGLHRLLKLAILDLSFNKITTTKSLGQLVANYNSLLALNLLGNPIQTNINEDQLRKRVCSLLPKLAFLNKQPISRQKVKEMATETIARHALRNSSRSARRKAVGKVSHDGPMYTNVHRSSVNTAFRSRGKAKTRAYNASSLKVKPSNVASSSR